ncbi:MAG: hypothetical protein JWL90_3497 [Chthoniobacteraceae bacterium]|nr:hypothetical protein [Chthoniobacteraceae bacterium]
MKTAPLFFVAAALALSACTTIVNRRDTYRPSEGNGPYSKALKDGTWRKGVKPAPAKTNIGEPSAPKPQI